MSYSYVEDIMNKIRFKDSFSMPRIFETGSSRNSDEGKLDYAGFNAPIVEWIFAQYMHKHRFLEDGTMRASDNWQKGFPQEEILKSLVRHVKDLELIAAGYNLTEHGKDVSMTDVLCAIRFNTNAYILSIVKGLEAQSPELKTINRNYEDTTSGLR